MPRYLLKNHCLRSYRVIDDWNRIPADLKRVDKNEIFKATYRTQRATQMDHAVRRER
jgi:hypothetical protein